LLLANLNPIILAHKEGYTSVQAVVASSKNQQKKRRIIRIYYTSELIGFLVV